MNLSIFGICLEIQPAYHQVRWLSVLHIANYLLLPVHMEYPTGKPLCTAVAHLSIKRQTPVK